MNRHITRNRLLASTVIGGLAVIAATPALAQDPAGASQVEEVVVTGSRIRRDATTSPTPLIAVTREDMDRSGEANVVDYLADVPALQFSTVPEDSTAALDIGGLSLLNLRNLGAQRTLTLVDGRRHVGSQPAGLGVDVDTIPRLLIESVEIITGGAASVYGADAVSGVANFILKKDYEGFEIDGSYAQINQNGETSQRISALWGQNFFDDSLNVYVAGEWKHNDEIWDKDLDWMARNWSFVTLDVDPASAPSDGVVDRVLIRDARTYIRGRDRGGITILATSIRPSPASDPDLPFVTCPTAARGANWSANCFFIAPPNRLDNAFVYDAAGNPEPLTFGSIRAVNGNVSNGGTGQFTNTQQAGDSRVLEQNEWRVQSGFTWDMTDNVTLFGEAKYGEEEVYSQGQRTFYDFNIYQTLPGLINPITPGGALGIGLDNAYLPAVVRNAIQNNIVTIYDANGNVTGTRADPRGQHKLYPTDRSYTNNRDLQRYVLGMRGDAGDVSFIRNLNWEWSYTFGEVNSYDLNVADGYLELQSAADAVVDTAGVVNGRPGEIVCRVRLLKAQGFARPGPALGAFPYTDDIIDNCVPIRIFGEGGISDAAREYIGAEISNDIQNRQQDFLAFMSGELWDFWGAGPMGFAVGVESRKESTVGSGRDRDTANRLLFLNTGAAQAAVSYETREAFAELRIPLFQDSWLGKSAEISGSYRTSDYSSVGLQDTWSVQGSWRPIDDLLFRATQNTAIRVPNLGELYGPQVQTFANGFADPCIIANINALPNPQLQAQTRANCRTLSQAAGFNFTFDSTTAPDAYAPSYGTGGIAGVAGGNPFLKPETSDSFTASVVWTPSFFPNFSLVLDYYKIEIADAIAATTAQQNANICVQGPTINQSACNTITRSPTTWMMTTFVQGSLNYAKLTAEGLDFTAKYRFDLQDLTGQDWGRVSWSLRGNYNIDRLNYTDIANPNTVTVESAGNYIDPTGTFLTNDSRVRFLSTLAWQPTDRLTVSWDWDFQSSQEIEDKDVLVANPDRYDSAKYLETGDFNQHDFTVVYQVTDDLRVNAGVINAFDEEPAPWLGRTTADTFDFFGRRYFVNFNYKVW